MASQKKPSIYSDRSTIGSSDELDEYGVWVKSEPQDLSSVNVEIQEPSVPGMEDLPDFDTGFDAETGEVKEDENIDFDGAEEFDDSGLNISEPDAGTEDDGGFDDLGIPEEETAEAPSGEGEAGFTEVSMEDFLDGGPALDDADIDDSSLEEEPSLAPAEEPAAADLSTRLLMKIADELSSIRSELSTLKKEFSVIRGEAPAEDRESAQRSGFFDEEDDEKIALTGDELDNILNTADFTEEAGADATAPAADDLSRAEDFSDTETLADTDDFASAEPLPDTDTFPSTELLSDGEDIIGGEAESPAAEEAPVETEDFGIDLELEQTDLDELGGENKIEESAVLNDDLDFDSGEFEISLDDSPSEEAVEPAADLAEEKDHEELKELREKGAEPMTSAPEDTSYLEEDPLAAEPEIALDETADELSMDEISLDDTAFDESSLDLSDAVIDEPDLSDQITENPLQEPSLDDISIDLDLDEEKSAGEDLSPETEMEFGVEEGDISLEEPAEEEAPKEEVLLPETAGTGETEPEEESFAQVIPEGFVVEAEDAQVPFEDDIEEEAFTEGEFTAGTGETAAETTAPGEAEEGEESILADDSSIPGNIRQELKTVLSYMDQLLESLPEEKIEEFAKSEYFDTYKKLFKELGLV
jgi:hypothetical protein